MSKHLPGVQHKDTQKFIFLWRQIDLLAISGDYTPGQINSEAVRSKQRAHAKRL